MTNRQPGRKLYDGEGKSKKYCLYRSLCSGVGGEGREVKGREGGNEEGGKGMEGEEGRGRGG